MNVDCRNCPNLGLPVKPYRDQEVEVVALYGRRIEQVSPFLDLSEFQTLDLDSFSLLHALLLRAHWNVYFTMLLFQSCFSPALCLSKPNQKGTQQTNG